MNLLTLVVNPQVRIAVGTTSAHHASIILCGSPLVQTQALGLEDIPINPLFSKRFRKPSGSRFTALVDSVAVRAYRFNTVQYLKEAPGLIYRLTKRSSGRNSGPETHSLPPSCETPPVSHSEACTKPLIIAAKRKVHLGLEKLRPIGPLNGRGQLRDAGRIRAQLQSNQLAFEKAAGAEPPPIFQSLISLKDQS